MLIPAAPRQIVLWSVAHGLVRLEEFVFDYVFYPYMLYSGGRSLANSFSGSEVSEDGGFWTGFVVLCIASLILNLIYLSLYNRSKRDWFGFESLKRLRVPQRVQGMPLLVRIVQCGGFIYLSVWHSPLFAALWMRMGKHQFQMSRRDWTLFFLAVAVANVGWTIAVSALSKIVAFLWQYALV